MNENIELDQVLDEADQATDAIEIDPRVGYKAAYRRLVKRELHDLPADLAARVAKPILMASLPRAARAIESGHSERLEGILADLVNDLRAGKRFEREHGELRPYEKANEIKKFSGTWSEKKWNGFEVSHAKEILEHGEHILAVEFRTLKTDRRTITRADLRAWAESRRFAWEKTVDDDEDFQRSWTSEHVITGAERAAERVETQRRVHTSGPAALIGKRF